MGGMSFISLKLSSSVQDVLATMLAMLSLFKTLTNFTLREFEM